MKKIIFTLPALLLLLSACDNTSVPSENSQPISEGTSESTPISSISEEESESTPISTPSEEVSESTPTSTPSEETSDSIEESVPSSSTQEVEEVVVSFANINESKSYRYSDHVEVFESYFPSGLLASTPEITNIYAQNTGDENDVRLTIGTGKDNGQIILELNKPIISLTIEGSDYHSSYSYGTTSGITYGNAKITVNSHSFEFTHVEKEFDIPPLESHTIEFEEPTSSLAISNDLASGSSASSGRAFIESLTFTSLK